MMQRFIGLRPWRRHSMVLAFAGVVYILYGVNLILVAPSASRLRGLELATEVVDLPGWGAVWVLVGLLALASTRWPPTSETWGYTAMSGLAALWSAVYALGMVFLGSPSAGVAGCLVWALVSFMWWGISGLRNPDDVVAPDTATSED